METEQVIEIFRDHLNMKDGTEFIWKDWEDAALHILTLATESEQLRKERDELFTWKNNARHAKAELDLERIRLQDIIRDMEAKLDKAKARATELEAILEARGE